MPEAASTPHAGVVFNPVKVDEQRLRTVVEAEAQRQGWADTRWYGTTVEDPGTGQARQAVEDGARVVLAAGGDGTIRAVAEGLRRSDVPIGLLPAGTGNLLARNLHLSLDRMDESVATAFEGVDRRIDIGLAEVERADGTRSSHAFVVMAGLGIDAAMIANTDPALKKRVGWLAYVGGILRSLKGDNRTHLRFKLDDEPAHSLRVNSLMVGNCGLLTGNILLLPEAVVDDGVFDIVALRPDGPIGWLQIAWKVLWENGVLRRSQMGRKLLSLTKEVHTLRYLRGRRIVFRTEEARAFQVDGDAIGEVVAVKATVDHLGLAVRIPADRADRLPATEEAAEEPAPA